MSAKFKKESVTHLNGENPSVAFYNPNPSCPHAELTIILNSEPIIVLLVLIILSHVCVPKQENAAVKFMQTEP